MKQPKKVIYILILLFTVQSCSLVFKKQDRFNVISDDASYTIPFQLVNDRILVKVRINDIEELNFIFDNGATESFISDTIAKSLNLPVEKYIKRGDMNAVFKKTPLYRTTNFSIYDLSIANYQLGGSETKLFRKYECDSNLVIDGLLGTDAFASFSFIKFDFVNKLIVLTKDTLEIEKDNYLDHEISVSKSGKSYIMGECNRKSFYGVIDFGSPNSIVAHKRYIDKSDIDVSKYIGSKSWGLNSLKELDTIYKVRNTIWLAGTSYNNEIIYGHKKNVLEGDLNIGLVFFSKFSNVIFNLKDERLLLSKEKKVTENKDLFKISISVKQDSIYVYSIDVTSDAYSKGLRPGDKIIKVNSSSVPSELLETEKCYYRNIFRNSQSFEIETQSGIIHEFKL